MLCCNILENFWDYLFKGAFRFCYFQLTWKLSFGSHASARRVQYSLGLVTLCDMVCRCSCVPARVAVTKLKRPHSRLARIDAMLHEALPEVPVVELP